MLSFCDSKLCCSLRRNRLIDKYCIYRNCAQYIHLLVCLIVDHYSLKPFWSWNFFLNRNQITIIACHILIRWDIMTIFFNL